jgi:hypothetical protein
MYNISVTTHLPLVHGATSPHPSGFTAGVTTPVAVTCGFPAASFLPSTVLRLSAHGTYVAAGNVSGRSTTMRYATAASIVDPEISPKPCPVVVSLR